METLFKTIDRYRTRKFAYNIYKLEKKCNRCNTKEKTARISVHHIDENPGNEDKTNYEILCMSCHIKHHNIGKSFTKEHKAKIGLIHKGKIVSKESRAKMSIRKKGKKLSKEHIEKIRINSIGESNGNYKGYNINGLGKVEWLKKTGKTVYQFYKLSKIE